ncbi:hypothetical protein J4E91_006708 [Alternaria rosae]|nr:hypothetical protein J4E91_006708 [Alternaria rosae]
MASLIDCLPATNGKKPKAHATVKEIIVLVRQCIERAKLACRTLFWKLTIAHWSKTKLKESLKLFTTMPTAPNQEILVEIALRRRMGKKVLKKSDQVERRVPNPDAKQTIEAWKTSERVSRDLELRFRTQQNGVLFAGLNNTTTAQADGIISTTYDGHFLNYHYAGTPTMHFVCAHNYYTPEKATNVDQLREWIVGSSRPQCRLFPHADLVYTKLREAHLGTAHINAVKTALQLLTPTKDAASHTPERIINGFIQRL